MKTTKALLPYRLLAVLLMACSSYLQAASISTLFNTGVDNSRTLLGTNQLDPHYTITTSPDPDFPGPNAFTLVPGFPVGPWVAEGPNSKWIAPHGQAGANAAPGTYTYTTTFDLTGLDPTTAQITGRLGTDDALGGVRLNGTDLTGITSAGFGSLRDFTIPAGSPFIGGTNTLEFDISNGGSAANPTGFRVEMAGIAIAPNEKPSVLAPPQSQTVIVGDIVNFTVDAVGTAPLRYQWRFNNNPISGATTNPFTMTGVTTNNAGNYSVVITNASGSVTSTVATLTVLMPFPGIYNTGVDANRALLADGAVDPHYKLTANSENPSSTEALAQSTIPSPPWIPNSNKSRWIGPLSDATAAGGNYTYQLLLDLTGYDPATAFLAGSWATDDGGSLFLNGIDTGFRSGSFTAFSQFSLTNGFVSGTNVLEIRLSNGGPNPTGLRVENLRGTAQPGGATSFAPRIVTQPRSATHIITTDVSLTVVADGTQPLTYQWFKGGALIVGKTNASLTFSPLLAGDAGSYSVRISNSLGSTNSDVLQLTTIPTQLGVFNTGVDTTGAALPIGQPDPHYLLISSADLTYAGPITYATAGPIPPWFANDADSQWISARPDGAATVAPGPYRYRLIFVLGTSDVATAAITAMVGTDDGNSGLFLNGTRIDSFGASGFGTLSPLEIPAGSSFVAGLNTLDFIPLNGGAAANPGGLRVDDLVLTGVEPGGNLTGLLGYWRMEETSGEVVIDSSGKGNNGQIVNSSSGVWVNDPARGPVYKATGQSVINFGTILPVMTVSNDFTWSLWINSSETANNNIVFGNRYNTNGAEFAPREFIKFTPSQFEWHFNGGGQNVDYPNFSTNQWVHHLVVKKGDRLTYYQNGLETTNAFTITGAPRNRQPLYLGGQGTLERWRGMADEVAIFERALSAADVQQVYQLGLAGMSLPGAVARLSLAAERVGSKVRLTWADASAKLESAPLVTGPWSEVTGATSLFEEDVSAAPQRFFRVRK